MNLIKSKRGRNRGTPFVFATAALLLSAPLFAQNGGAEAAQPQSEEVITLTLDDAVAYAHEHSRALKSADIDLEIAKRGANYSWNVFLGTLQASGTLNRTTNIDSTISSLNMGRQALGQSPLTEKEGMHWNVIGNVSMGVNLSLAYIGQIKAAYAQYEVGKISWAQTERETITNIKKLFYGLLLQQENLAIQRTTLENARERSEQAETNYRNGLIPELQLLQVQVQYENQIPVLEQAETALSQQLDTFVFLLGMPDGTKVSLSGSLEPQFVDVDADDLIARYATNSLDIQSLDNNITVLKHNLSALNFASFSPALSLNYNWQPTLPMAFDENHGDWTDGGSFSATLAWNLVNMLPFSANRQQAKDVKANINKLEIQREQLIENHKLTVRTSVDNLNQARRQIDSMNRNVVLAQRSYDMTLRSYQNGTTELLDLRDAETQLNQARLGLLNQQYQYISALLDLEDTLNTTLLADETTR